MRRRRQRHAVDRAADTFGIQDERAGVETHTLALRLERDRDTGGTVPDRCGHIAVPHVPQVGIGVGADDEQLAVRRERGAGGEHLQAGRDEPAVRGERDRTDPVQRLHMKSVRARRKLVNRRAAVSRFRDHVRTAARRDGKRLGIGRPAWVPQSPDFGRAGACGDFVAGHVDVRLVDAVDLHLVAHSVVVADVCQPHRRRAAGIPSDRDVLPVVIGGVRHGVDRTGSAGRVDGEEPRAVTAVVLDVEHAG